MGKKGRRPDPKGNWTASRPGASDRGLEAATAESLAEQIETFGRYGFNLSHSAAYSLLSYQTAWLKRYYPSEFMAALLSSVLDKTDDVVKYIAECREMGRYVPGLDDGNHGPASRCQRKRLEIHRRGRPFGPVRPGGREGGRVIRRPVHPGGPRKGRSL